ncbi:ATP-binding protein [Microbacterium terricola]|uniref:ATPase n=1 Tax=Microbacterium terricola TaxID=344163 RepID=A0ABM8E199_9MICO|nr:ATP-binding protein [Microbacterium terricola]UYK40707.1 ATP-binding protein [Microbacterium terricola]BDV31556.1 ATPase [Microbacterium terricola]
MTERLLPPSIDPRVVGLRERARAVLGVAVMGAGDGSLFVDGARSLLAADAGARDDLGGLFGLSADAAAVLTLALAPDLDAELGVVFGALAGDPTVQRPSLALALRLLFEHPSPDARIIDELRRHGLAVAAPRDFEPLIAAPLVPSPGLVAHLIGTPSLPSWCATADGAGLAADAEALELSVPTAARLNAEDAVRTADLDVLQLWGPDRRSLREAAALAARSLGKDVIFTTRADQEAVAELRREAVLRAALIVIDGDGGEPTRLSGRAITLLRPLIQLSDARETGAVPPGAVVRAVEVGELGVTERETVWRAALPTGASLHAPRLARRFRLAGWQIRSAIEALAATPGAPSGDRLRIETVEAAARAQTGRELERLAPHVDALARWRELVLPPDALEQLDEVVSRVDAKATVVETWGFGERRRTHPIAALFLGPSGTGKTMAAEAIAARLGLSLHVIDLSRVVSKYIGETEQQLDAIFEAASRTNAVLFFDEADALFGKRSEVRDAHDRYANIEVSYLLQRMESYDGVTLLATNLASNIDEAFTRRLDFTVHFPFPGPPARRILWAQAWPASTPLEVDGATLDDLAESYELAGGSIRNVAVAAAFLAARDGTAVTDAHVDHALRRELRKLGAGTHDRDRLVIA